MNKKNLISKFWIFVFLTFLLQKNIYGLGIAPSKIDLFFEPNTETEVYIRLINNEKKDTELIMLAKGDLANYIILPDEKIFISANEYEKQLKYKIKFPQKLNPGQIVGEIWLIESAEKSKESNLIANLGVIHKVYVHVPYPDQFLEGILYVSESKPGEKVTFTITLTNMGSKDINNIQGQILIKENGKALNKVITDSISLKKKEKGKITGVWTFASTSGKYEAEAIVEYDNGKVLSLQKEFTVGEPAIIIENIRVGKFNLGNIAKFDISLKNNWNNRIENIYTTTEIRDVYGRLLNTYNAPSVDIESYSSKDVNSYWDTKGISEGDYSIGVIANYLDKKTEKVYELKLGKNEIKIKDTLTGKVIEENKNEYNNFIPLLIGIIIILGILIIFMLAKIKGKSKDIIPKREVIQKAGEEKNEKEIKKDILKQPKSDLKEYIKYNLKQGISISAIKKRLLEKGYDEKTIDSLILEIEDEII
ncbi:MAG: hypothetical protein KatS3mg002_1642 [Candidatus Woesearchaeota archaeon]|nr:MAG: hypothetical protein KatS3mg002_1642 [Candidatus Woesearchaeota archaeon]